MSTITQEAVLEVLTRRGSIRPTQDSAADEILQRLRKPQNAENRAEVTRHIEALIEAGIVDCPRRGDDGTPRQLVLIQERDTPARKPRLGTGPSGRVRAHRGAFTGNTNQ